MGYIINEWALVRRGELAVTPETLEIHPDFLRVLTREECEAAFRRVGDMFYRIMTDISTTPERFAMPLYDEAATRYGAAEAQESRNAAWRPMKLLYAFFANGKTDGRSFTVNVLAFKMANKIKNIHLLLKALSDYGFCFSGLTNNKLTPKTVEFIIEFPDDPNVIKVMALLAGKATALDAEESFMRWSYRLLLEPFGEFNFGSPFYAVYDKSRAPGEKEFIESFHAAMTVKNYFWRGGGGNEGPGIRYYDSESVMKRKGPYLFQLWDNKGDLRLYLRIRNAEKCFALYDEEPMPDEVTDMFDHSEPGCGNRANGTCNMGIEYTFGGVKKWHCGCCGALFWLRPAAENISHYLRLLEAGEKRTRDDG